MNPPIDAVDMKLLAELQRDASLSTPELAVRIGLSQSPCWRRLQRLRAEGYIQSTVAIVDRRKFGFTLQIGCCQTFRQCLFSGPGERRLGIRARKAGQQPMAMHGGVPVITSIEGRRELARGLHIAAGIEHVRNLGWIFAVHARQS